MITIDGLAQQVAGLQRQDLQRWIDLQWVRPEGQAGQWVFRDIDVARVRLIITLRTELQITEEALPTVLSLLDQLYDTRRQLRHLVEAMDTAPADWRQLTLAAVRVRRRD